VRRFASLGVALALAVGTLVPVAHAQQSSGKTVVMGFTQEPDTFVAGEGGLYVTQVAMNLVYSQLVVIDDLMRPIADLATDVPTLDNGDAVMVGDGADQHLETTFHLRQDAKFSDGTPLTAEDVVFSWKLSLNPVWGAAAGNDLESKYADVVAKDQHTVVFKMMSQNQARAAGQASQQGPVIHPFYLYGLPDVMIYPSKRMASLVDFDPQNSPKVKDLQSSVFSRQPVGTGPYSLDSWDPGVQMVFHARADYFRGKPPLDTIIIRGFEASKETLLAQLQAGDIQTIGSETLDVSDVDAVNAIPGVKAYVRAGTTIEHIDFNLDNPVLADKNVRKAIAFALDRQDLVNRVLSGQSSVADSVIPPISPLFNPDTPKYAFNPDQARAMLDAAGWTVGSDGIRVNSSGQRLSLKYQSTNAGIRKKTMPLVKDQLAAVGIEVNIDQVPAQTYFGSTGPLRQRTFDLGEYASVGSQDSGVDVVTEYSSKFIPNAANNFGGQNYPGWNNSSADQLINQQASTLVPGTRQSAMNALQLLMAEELPTVPLYFRPNVTAASNRLANWKPEYASNGYTWNVWEWDLR
jgi:peptide/nickel transport system substrate-binding protein